MWGEDNVGGIKDLCGENQAAACLSNLSWIIPTHVVDASDVVSELSGLNWFVIKW